jgi:hypothetical protein
MVFAQLGSFGPISRFSIHKNNNFVYYVISVEEKSA